MDRLHRFYLSSISIFVGRGINLRTAGFKKREQERESDPPPNSRIVQFTCINGITCREGFYAPPPRHRTPPALSSPRAECGGDMEGGRHAGGEEEGRKTPPYNITHREKRK
jgi:hypothetical protein